MLILKVCHAVEGLSPEARFLLLCLVQGGAGGGLAVTVLRARLGVSERVMSRLGRELKELDYVIEKELVLPTGKRGRAIELSSRFRGLDVWTEVDRSFRVGMVAPWAKLSERMLMLPPPASLPLRQGVSGKKFPHRKGAGKDLSASNRLLMAVLLALADDCGVVRGIWPKAIARLVGMSGVQLRYQLGKLLGLGYLRAVVPGVTGRSLFGVSPGAYFLNLSHPDYADSVPPSSWLIYPASVMGEGSDRKRDAAVLYRQLMLSGQRHLGSYWGAILMDCEVTGPDQVALLREYFDGVGSPNLPDYFQMKIEEYASWMLTHHRRVLTVAAWEQTGLLQKVAADLFPKQQMSAGVDGAIDKEGVAKRTVVIRLVSLLAIQLATRIDRALRGSFRDEEAEIYSNQLVNPDGCSCLIMPVVDGGARHVAIHVVPLDQNAGPSHGSRVCHMQAHTSLAWISTSEPISESGLSNTDAYGWGMLTLSGSSQ